MALIPRKRMSSDLLDPKPKKGSFNGVTSDGVFNATGEAIDNILDDGSASETVVVAVPSSQSSNYTVGNYYEVQGKVARLRTKTEGDDVTQLTFDTTSGVLDAMNGIVEDIESIGSPLQWKGPATVAQLNAGITGIQEGWTYTLTDAGTLTDGSIAVEAGDEVAWTEDGEWFKVGGDSGKVAVFYVDYDLGQKVYPDPDEILAAVDAGKFVVIDEPNQGVWNHTEWLLESASRGAQDYIKFVNGSSTLTATKDNTLDEPTWQWDTGHLYDDQLDASSNNAVQNSTLYTVIGAIKNGGALTDGASVTVPNNALSTLSTAQSTLTLNVNVGSNDVPNFAVEVSPSADCTLTVTKTVGNTTTTLNPSVAGGNSLTTGKLYQVTCVGNCWTLAEFGVPTP